MVTDLPLSFEQLGIGDKWISPARTIVASDLMSFADLTGDHDRLHTDAEFAANGPFGRPVAHGLLGLSILAGLSSNAPAVQTSAFVDIRSWSFCKPIYIGDQIHAVTEIIDLKERGRKHGEVHWYRQLINQSGEKVQDGILITLVARSVPLPSKRLRLESTSALPNDGETQVETFADVIPSY